MFRLPLSVAAPVCIRQGREKMGPGSAAVQKIRYRFLALAADQNQLGSFKTYHCLVPLLI